MLLGLWFRSLVFAALSAAIASMAYAQQGAAQRANQQNAQSGQAPPGQRAAQGPQMDRVLVSWLMVDNEGEVALARFAEERAHSPEVKKFAKMVITDHSEFLKQLQQVQGTGRQPAGEARPANPPARRQNDGASRDQSSRLVVQPVAQQEQPTPRPRQPAAEAQAEAGRGRPTEGGPGIIGIKQELGKHCLENTQKFLGKLQGAEFDHAYMGHQVVMHMQMVDTLEVFSHHASPQAAATMQKGAKTAKEHLDHALQIKKELESSSAK